MRSLLFTFVLLCSVGTAGAAQGQAFTRGVLTDESGAVVRDALATVTAQGVGPERSTRTDDRGMFEVASLPPGLYVLRVERAGFATLTRSNVEAAPAPPMLELRLETGGVTESVTVLATRSRLATKAETPILQTPQAISVVPEALLDEQGTVSLGEALRNVSGAALSGNWRGTYEIYAQRGFYSDSDGNFRRNGIEISKFTSLLSSNTERVEVLKGPASVLYGRIDWRRDQRGHQTPGSKSLQRS